MQTVAECIATALKALKFIFLTDVKGLIIEDKLQQVLTLENAQDLSTH